MKRVFIFVVFLFMLGGLTRVDAQEKETLVKVGDNVPEFVVEMFDGQKIDIKDLKGKIVFDVTKATIDDKNLQLQVQTGAWGTEKGLINLH